MKQNGFTLIELLAVIVILAVIALIATPMVMNIIEDTRRAAVTEDAISLIDKALMNAVIVEDIDSSSVVYDAKNIEIKNNKFSDGTVTIDEKGIATLDFVCTDDYCISGTKDNLVVTSVGEEVLVIRMNTGLMDFSVTGADNLKWYFPDGTTSTLERPAVTLTAPGVVYAICDDWSKNTIAVNDNATNGNYIGDLSDLSSLTHFVICDNCYNITGDISFLRNITYYANFYGCTNLTGDISALNNLTFFARFNYCVNLTGVLTPTSTLKYAYLSSFGISTPDLNQSIINLNNVTEINNGILDIRGLIRTNISDDAINSLIAKGWNVLDATVVY
jgi:type IV pilus assembly protein PilA